MRKQIINISDNFEVNISTISEIGKIIDLSTNNPMFSFILEFKNGSYRNICLHYDSKNRTIINQKVKALHKEIKFYLEKQR